MGSQVGNRHFSVVFLSFSKKKLAFVSLQPEKREEDETKGYMGRKQSSELCFYRR